MKTIFKICIVLLALSSNAYCQNWLWVKSQGIDPNGSFTSQTKLGSSGNLITFLAENNATHLIFTNVDGDVVWTKTFQKLIIREVLLDNDDNIYFAGTFTGSTTIGSNTFVSQGSTDAIIGKFNNSGTLIKSKAFGTAQSEYAYSLALGNNELIVTGSFIYSQTVDNISLTGSGINFDTYILKFDLNLMALKGFATDASCCLGAHGVKVAIDKNNSIYLLGRSQNPLVVGTTTVLVADNDGGDGYFLAKFDLNFNVTWVKTLIYHWSEGHYIPFIYLDTNSNIILGRVIGGGGGGMHNLLVEKYNQGGGFIWGKEVSVNDGGYMDIDNQDNIWVAGRYTNFDGPSNFSIVKINTAGVATQLFMDVNILHPVQGLAVKANDDFYLLINCNGSSSLNGITCSPENTIFMSRYGMLTGINDHKISNNTFNVYPNPATGIITISCNSGIKSGCTLIIKNVLGQLVYRDPLKEASGSFSKDIDLSTQPKGTYFVEMESDQERTIKRVIVQ